jgi:hypothetical protein
MSSKRRIRRNACTGKRRFATLTEALAANRFRITAYRCAFCSGWHLGHSKARRLRF